MATNLFLAFVALGCALLLARSAENRRFGIIAAILTGVLVLLQMGFLVIRIDSVRMIAWAAVAVLAGVLLSRQHSREGGALSTGLLFAAALPLGRAMGFLH